jgi:hypothetical protein
MRARACILAASVVVALGAGEGRAAAQDVGWMRPGVRLWYLGGVGGSGVTSSNAEEAYLVTAVSGGSARVVRHSALTHWTSPQPVDTSVQPALGIASCWIHPAKLATLQMGEYWLGQEITLVVRATYTYSTFLATGLPAKVNFLPIKALFDIQPVRQIVKIRYMLAGFSFGTAYFDADTGIMLYHDSLWGTSAMFFVLAEINYDFARHAAFPEDDGPHTGYNSFVSEQSLGKNWVGGGSVVIQSLVESRYGPTVEMRVTTSYTPSSGGGMFDENYCFFGAVPLVTKMDATQAGNLPPEQWNPFGEHLWWWIPPGGAAAQPPPLLDGVSAAAPANINVYTVPMAKTSDNPLTYVATQSPSAFHFEALWFDSRGYMTSFAAKGSGGLDVKPTDDYFQNLTKVDGRSYYLGSMRYQRPRADLNGDGMSDLAVFRPGDGAWWVYGQPGAVWFGQGGDVPVVGDYDGDGVADLAVFRPATGEWIIRNQRTVTFGQPDDVPVPADYNGDGKTDLAVFRPATGEWLIEGDAPVVWGMRGDVPVPADYNGDGLAEIAVFRPTTGCWYVVGGTTLQWGMWGDMPVPADYNGDGKADIAVYRPSTGWWYVAQGVMAQWGSPGDAPVPLDVDGDGAAEFVVFRPAEGKWFAFDPVTSHTASAAWGQAGDLPVGTPPQLPETTLRTAGDFDHDGAADVTVFRPSTGGWYSLKSTFAYHATETVVLGQSGDVPVPGAYQGTGRQERAVYRPATGQWVLEDGRTFMLGAPGDVPVPADYDGDGKTDLGVYRPSTGYWYILTSSSGFASYEWQWWGAAGDIAVPGDYNGDGVAEVAVYRPSNGTWYVMDVMTVTGWGTPTDVPILGRQ